MGVVTMLIRPVRRLGVAVRYRWAQFKQGLRRAAEGQRYFPLGADLALTRLRNGHTMFVDPQDETISAHLIAHGVWETSVSRMVRRLVGRGQVAVEVGANLGYYTLILARAVGPAGRVIALEANARLAGLAQRSIDFNGYGPRVRLLAQAASDRPGALSFMSSRRSGGSGHLLVPESAIAEDQVVTVVDSVRLDDVTEGQVDFIRLDAEGSEPLVLKGAARLLAHPDIVVCMEWSVVQMRSRTSVPDFVDWLSGQGFRFWRIEEGLVLSPVPAEGMAEIGHCEVVLSRHRPRLHPIGPT